MILSLTCIQTDDVRNTLNGTELNTPQALHHAYNTSKRLIIGTMYPKRTNQLLCSVNTVSSVLLSAPDKPIAV